MTDGKSLIYRGLTLKKAHVKVDNYDDHEKSTINGNTTIKNN